MKKTLFYLIILTLILNSCSEDSKLISKEEINLIAPNGQRLSSIDQLKGWTALIVSDKFGSDKSFEIIDVEYFNVKEGFVAQINFTVGNVKSHYLIGNTTMKQSNGRTQNCSQWQITCSGTTCCTPTFNLGTGTASCECSSGSNSGCTLTAKCLDNN